MKKLILFLSMAMLVMQVATAQKKVLKAAESALDDGKLDEALNLVNQAAENEETKILPKTFFIKGKILQAIALSTDAKYATLVADPLNEFYNAYSKSLELDPKKYKSDIEFQYLKISPTFYNQAIEAFNQKDYVKALNNFEIRIKLEDQFKNIDTNSIYNAALSAYKAKQYDKAILYFNKSIEYNFAGSYPFTLLKDVYFEKGDTANAVVTIKKAFEKYPNELSVIVDLVNYYINKGESKEALAYLEKAKEKDPNNVSFYFAEGNLYERMNEIDKAVASYKTSIEKDPNYLNGYYNLGVLYVNKAKKLYDDANATADNTKYADLLKQGDEELKKALPYMEKAHQIDAKEKAVMEALKSIYFRLQMNDELNKIKAELEQAQ